MSDVKDTMKRRDRQLVAHLSNVNESLFTFGMSSNGNYTQPLNSRERADREKLLNKEKLPVDDIFSGPTFLSSGKNEKQMV